MTDCRPKGEPRRARAHKREGTMTSPVLGNKFRLLPLSFARSPAIEGRFMAQTHCPCPEGLALRSLPGK